MGNAAAPNKKNPICDPQLVQDVPFQDGAGATVAVFRMNASPGDQSNGIRVIHNNGPSNKSSWPSRGTSTSISLMNQHTEALKEPVKQNRTDNYQTQEKEAAKKEEKKLNASRRRRFTSWRPLPLQISVKSTANSFIGCRVCSASLDHVRIRPINSSRLHSF